MEEVPQKPELAGSTLVLQPKVVDERSRKRSQLSCVGTADGDGTDAGELGRGQLNLR